MNILLWKNSRSRAIFYSKVPVSVGPYVGAGPQVFLEVDFGEFVHLCVGRLEYLEMFVEGLDGLDVESPVCPETLEAAGSESVLGGEESYLDLLVLRSLE